MRRTSVIRQRVSQGDYDMADKLMVVAHPDDEMVFGGAHLLRERKWKVICVTNRSNRIRSNEFVKVMQRVGAEYEIWDYEDAYEGSFNWKGLQQDLLRVIGFNRYKKVVTHSLRGEYGHPQHKAIAKLMREMIPCNLHVFALGKQKIPQKMLLQKRQVLNLYVSQRQTLDELQLDKYINREYFVRVK